MSQLSVKDCAELAGLGDIGIRKLTRFVRLLNQHGRLTDGSVLRIPAPRLSKSDRKIQQVMNMLKELAEKEKAEKQP